MNINASAETVRAVVKVFELAYLLDDRVTQPDKARMTAWAEQVERHRLSEQDLLDAVQAFYDGPSLHAIQVGDLISHARRIKRDRLEREPDADRDERRELVDEKAANDIRPFTSLVGGGGVDRAAESTELDQAREALQTCHGKAQSQAAIRSYLDALRWGDKLQHRRYTA